MKHLKGLTFVSGSRGRQQAGENQVQEIENVRVRICLSRCSSRVKDWPQ